MTSNCRRSRAVFAGTAALVLSTLAAAGPILEEVQEMTFNFPLSPGAATLAFSQFDDEGGSRLLTKVTIVVESTLQAMVTAENDASIASPDFALNISGFVTVDVADLSTSALLSESFLTGGVAASDGVNGSGPDFFDFGLISASDNAMAMTEVNVAQFLGDGEIEANVAAAGGFTVAGSTDSTLVITDFLAMGLVRITYEYELVPGPSVLALLGLAGLAGYGRRRRA